jgi:uncharacterized cysteine cluster protein YcgN (CxxCxxCC family)
VVEKSFKLMNAHLKDKIDIHLRILEKQKPLEDYCNNCGDCCRPSVHIKNKGKDGKVLVPDLSCKFLSEETKKCSVYKNRHNKAPWCVDLKSMISKGLAPSDCPYVEGLGGYIPTLKLDSDLHKSIVPLLKLAISRGPKEPYNQIKLKEFLGE